jgi:hypothetical protein
MKRIFLMVSAAALLAGTTVASAQVRDSAGRNPGIYGGYRAYGAYPYSAYAYGAYPYGPYDAYAYAPGRYYGLRPDNPPGSRFQDRGIDEENGVDPLSRGH